MTSLVTEPPFLGTLPEAVRLRVVAHAATALGLMPVEQLPPALKRVADFAPARRAKLAAHQIASVLETDENFRAHLATQVRQQLPETASALDSSTTPAAMDPVELAAVAYLLRPEGWTSLVFRASETAEAKRSSAASRRLGEKAERLRRQLEDATTQLRTARARSREQIDQLKAENTELRHKLGGARTRERSAQLRAGIAEASAAASVEAAQLLSSSAVAEARRLRAKVDELERDVRTARRTGRAGRDAGALRARLLLDALLESAQGLRRELALPTVEGAPADVVAADVAQAGTRASSSHGSMAADDPALLDQLLNLPRVHLIVDGYNVTKSAWPESSLETQRDRLMSGLAPLAARSGAEVTVVFDAGDVAERPLVNRPRGVRVLFSPMGVIADDVIRQLVAAEPQGRPLVVVSSDQELVRDVLHVGARAVAAAALGRLLARA